MTLRLLPIAGLLSLLTACQAYRAKPESDVFFTRDELTKKGFVLAPIAVGEEKLNPGVSELVAYDVILANTLKTRWPNVTLLPSSDIATTLDSDSVEVWRKEMAKEEASVASPSTLKTLKKLTEQGRAYPKQVLLPSLLMNTVSCGQKDVAPTAVSPEPRGTRAYCQRIVKMRFRIMALESTELLWNGLIYATQEAVSDIEVTAKTDPEKELKPVDPPATQSLIRECFNNFAKQFTER